MSILEESESERRCAYDGEVSDGGEGAQRAITDGDFAQGHRIGRAREEMFDDVGLDDGSI